jgi:hypothetical protein
MHCAGCHICFVSQMAQYAECCYTECRYAECRGAGWRGGFFEGEMEEAGDVAAAVVAL